MVATVTAIAEKKKCSAIAAIIWKPLSSNCSDRSDNDRWDTTSSISANVVAAIAELFSLSDRSGHMETRLNKAIVSL